MEMYTRCSVVVQASEVLAGTDAPVGAVEPNVWVAHLRDGMEAVELGSGRTVCKLHLASPGLHVDLDGDGVLDHIQASGVLLDIINWFCGLHF